MLNDGPLLAVSFHRSLLAPGSKHLEWLAPRKSDMPVWAAVWASAVKADED